MRLPKLVYDSSKGQIETVKMGSINYSDAISDGDMADSKNISARRYPYITTRHQRTKQTDYQNATALTFWGELVVVEGTKIYYGNAEVGTVLSGEKQFAVVNTKLVIWPDKKYMDVTGVTPALHDLGADVTFTGATFTTNTITITDTTIDFTTMFKAGDGVEVTGCTVKPANNKSFVIKSLTSQSLTTTADAFTAGTETGELEIVREIPDMDFICESENRLFGCSSSTQTIYASSLGDPTNFNVFEGVSTDAYAVAVGSEGDFTGCCKLSSSVLFWKEQKLHKMLGSYPAEYSIYTYDIEGLQASCYKSMQVINEVLYYLGIHGVYAYSGGQPTLISSNFGNKDFTNGTSGNDGDTYYLSVKEGTKKYLFAYETRQNLWVLEEDIHCKDFARTGKELYFLKDNGDVYLLDNGNDDGSVEWKVQFKPFFETIKGRKKYSRFLIRLELPQKSYVSIQTKEDERPWQNAGKIVGKSNTTTTIRLPQTRCDKYGLKLEGKGPCTILEMLREVELGSGV